MKKISLRASVTFFLFLFNYFPALAQDILNITEIEQYLVTYPQIHKISQEYEASNEEEEIDKPVILDQDEFSRTPISDNLDQLRTHPTFEKFTDIIKKAGFSSPRQWASAGDKIMMAYSAYQIKHPQQETAPSIEEIKKDMDEQRNLIEKNQFISNEQKQSLINKIENSMALLSDPNYIDSENISIISPYIERLNSLFKEYQ